jgi:hypothetical protein
VTLLCIFFTKKPLYKLHWTVIKWWRQIGPSKKSSNHVHNLQAAWQSFHHFKPNKSDAPNVCGCDNKTNFQTKKTLQSPGVETWFFGLNAQCYEFMQRVGKLITVTSLDFWSCRFGDTHWTLQHFLNPMMVFFVMEFGIGNCEELHEMFLHIRSVETSVGLWSKAATETHHSYPLFLRFITMVLKQSNGLE